MRESRCPQKTLVITFLHCRTEWTSEGTNGNWLTKMLKLIFIVGILANVGSFVLEPEDDTVMTYKNGRALLTPEQEEFLMELLAADDALIDAASRGIVDDILAALAGINQVNIVGPDNQQTQQQQQQAQLPVSATQFSQPPNNPTLPVGANDMTPQQQAVFTAIMSSLGSSPISAQAPPFAPGPSQTQAQAQPFAPIAPNPGQTQEPSFASGSPQTQSQQYAPGPSQTQSQPFGPGSGPQFSSGQPPSYSQGQRPAQQTQPFSPVQVPRAPNSPAMTQQNANTTAVGGNNNHLFNTIQSVIMGSSSRNVTQIVDQSLRIATPAPVRELVTSILNAVYCNSVRRLMGRC
ncbi:hypothetical protein Ocin01_11478 [Orchesella cincta]|uniref:Uncharacterized protein n=1 Tax=Orchesella cincta TaxID=48709 RepID=A0A1D2MQR5_ORCCI|nr:hypothetical protein Ocin01_11478 [Orchesella cincta]